MPEKIEYYDDLLVWRDDDRGDRHGLLKFMGALPLEARDKDYFAAKGLPIQGWGDVLEFSPSQLSAFFDISFAYAASRVPSDPEERRSVTERTLAITREILGPSVRVEIDPKTGGLCFPDLRLKMDIEAEDASRSGQGESFDGPIVYGEPVKIEDEGAYFYSMKVNEPDRYNEMMDRLRIKEPKMYEEMLKLIQAEEEGAQ